VSSGARKYRVIRRIGDGGMAEVFQAKMLCQPGYSKMVAIKRVLPRLSRNERFIKMFLDEARLGLLLNHANIVHVFDVGQAADAYFIVMEYVDGVNLKQSFESFKAQGELLPLEISLAIGVEICRGLDYAHHLYDQSGSPVNVVHHDVNPANVLVSVNGEVKLVDFGLAEARAHIQRSDPDLVRGKFGYLSPEAALGRGTDARSDLFAVAVILYELVTGKRLFRGSNDLENLRLAQAAEVPPPREINAEISPALERTLLRALARNPDERFQRGRELGAQLTEVLFEMGRPVSGFAIGELVEIVRGHRRDVQHERVAHIGNMIDEELARMESYDPA
jgi:serine/threonine-protein kinase